MPTRRMAALNVPGAERRTVRLTLREPRTFGPPARPLQQRSAYAAVHVVADPLADVANPLEESAIDWDATLAFRRYIWAWGLGVAEAMDTAQRGQGVSWPIARELIRRSCAEARHEGRPIVCGATTDQLDEDATVDVDAVVRAYDEQCDLIESGGGVPVLMPSRHLGRIADGPAAYIAAYGRVLRARSRPAIIHWLGARFDPRLTDYWGTSDLDGASETILEIVGAHQDRVAGIKVSVLDVDVERRLRGRLPAGVRLYTGDDHHFPELIEGDESGHSDALLGVFDAMAPAASAALVALEAGDIEGYHSILEPTLPLARLLFAPPTWAYKTGLTLLAYLNGHQDHFRMLRGMEAARSILHLAQVVILADGAGILRDPDLAASRMARVLSTAGVEQG